MSLSAIVLAAGRGTRMKSELPKPLHRICGRPILAWVIDSLDDLDLAETAIVVGYGGDAVVAALRHEFGDRRFLFAEQLAQRGTGDAAAVGLAQLDLHSPEYDDDDHVVIIPGDTPLLRPETIADLVRTHIDADAACTLTTARLPDPTGYGRVIRGLSGNVMAIVEERDATAEQRAMDEINAGMYCFRRSLLAPSLRLISGANAQNELYLTDVVGILSESGHPVVPYQADDIEISGVNDRAQMGAAAAVIAARIAHRWMRSGVTIVQPSSTVIDATVLIDPDVVVHAGSVLEGTTVVGAGAVIGPHTRLVDATIGQRAIVEASTVRGAAVASDTRIGPYEVLDDLDISP